MTDIRSGDQLEGKIAIVTGSGRGIGRGIAELFAAQGAKVVVATRTASYGEETVAAIAGRGGDARLFQTELGDEAAIDALIDFTLGAYGNLHVMVHNAALPLLVQVEEMTTDCLDRTLTVNIKASAWLTTRCIPIMRANGGGRILFTGSTTGQRAVRGGAAYAMSKAGLNGWIRSAAYELGQYGITVNGVEPGLIWTDAMTKHNYQEGQVEQLLGTIPLARAGTPNDIAEAMLYLASDGAAYVTGQTIVVDGGLLLPESGALMLQGR